jgi:drug/metabolite transporter (DMT)-like permease
MLVVVTILWGMSFPLIKSWQNAAQETECPGGAVGSTMAVLVLRTILALGILLLFRRDLFRNPTRRELAIGVGIGLLNFLGSGLQLAGLSGISPALCAFFTSLGSAWVPVLAFVFFGIRAARLTLLGLMVAVAGAAMLARVDSAGGWHIGWGEQLNLAASVVFAIMIVGLDRYGRSVGPGHLTVGLLSATGLPALVTIVIWAVARGASADWWRWAGAMAMRPRLVVEVVLLTVFCTMLAFHWFTVYQPRVSANRAALIYLLEPVAAAVFAVLWGLETITARLVLGGGLIVGGNLLIELPALLRRRAVEAPVDRQR